VRNANVVLFLLRSCFARSIDGVLCAKELSRIVQLDATEALGPRSLQDPAQDEPHLSNPDAGWRQGIASSLIRFFGVFLDFFMMICLTLVGGNISTPGLTAMADFRPS